MTYQPLQAEDVSLKTAEPMSFAPGPWEVQRGALDQVFVISGSRVCTVMPRYTDAFRDPAVDFATARLIAAAPDLLAALKDVLRIATAASMGVSSNAKRLERARAAIAKATQP